MPSVCDIENQQETQVQPEKILLEGNLGVKVCKNGKNGDDNILSTFKCCIVCCFLSLVSPLIVCDLYFGFSKDQCLTEHPDKFEFKLKTYLLTSGFVSLFLVIFYIMTIIISKYNEEDSMICMVFGVGLNSIAGSFSVIWNILGAVLFWDYIYPNNKCNDSSLSTYLFVSLIIKLIGSFSILCNSKNNDE
jgi:hypothetical protein